MMPTATHAAGSRRGFYLGHTLSGSRQPVTFNLREGSDSNRNATILSVGALGSGKTTLAQKLKYEGFLQGATGDRLRSEGRPPLPPAAGGGAARRVRHAAPGPGAARHARSAAGRAGAPAPGRGGVVPARPAARAGGAGVGDGGRRRGRPCAHTLVRAHLPRGGASARARATRPTYRSAGRSTSTPARD